MDRNRTSAIGTLTLVGFVPHVRAVFEDLCIEAPVKIAELGKYERPPTNGLRRPVINASGRYVHILPNGASIEGERA